MGFLELVWGGGGGAAGLDEVGRWGKGGKRGREVEGKGGGWWGLDRLWFW